MRKNLDVVKFREYILEKSFDEILKNLKINEAAGDEGDDNKVLSSIIDGLKSALSLGLDTASWLKSLLDKLGHKKWVLVLGIAAIISLGYDPNEAIDDLKTDGVEITDSEKKDVIEKAEEKTEDVVVKTEKKPRRKSVKKIGFGKEGKDIDKFLKIMATRESSNRADAINQVGYIGLYQFGVTALKDVGLYPRISKYTFKKNPKIWPASEQHKAMKKLIKKNKIYLKDYYKFVGKKIGGVKITEAGLLAGAHLVGHGGVKKFLKSNGKIVPVDGNGTPVTEYMKMFQNKNFDI